MDHTHGALTMRAPRCRHVDHCFDCVPVCAIDRDLGIRGALTGWPNEGIEAGSNVNVRIPDSKTSRSITYKVSLVSSEQKTLYLVGE